MEALQLDIRPFNFVLAKIFASFLGSSSYYKWPGRTIKLVDIPEPELPDSSWVKIKTIYCGFCGSDFNLITLNDSPGAQPFTSFPCIIGHEFIGEITETGGSVKDYKEGDLVAVNPFFGCKVRNISPPCPECSRGQVANCRNHAEGCFPPGMFIGITKGLNGGFAPYTVAHESQLFKIPDGLTNESAVMTEPVAVALQTVFDNIPADEENILIIGAGVIGNLIIQSIRALDVNCKISVMEPSYSARQKALEAGADHTIKPSEIFDKTVDITKAKIYRPLIGKPIIRGGFAKVFDTVGNSDTLGIGLRIMQSSGILSLTGIGSGLKIDPTTLWLKLQTIQGVYGYRIIDFNGIRQHVFKIAMDFMLNGKIKAENLISHKFKLKDYHRMIDVNMNKTKYNAFKTIITFDENENQIKKGV